MYLDTYLINVSQWNLCPSQRRNMVIILLSQRLRLKVQ